MAVVKAFRTIASYLVRLWNNAQNSSNLRLITCPKTAISGPRQNQLQPLTGDCHIGHGGLLPAVPLGVAAAPRHDFSFCLIQHNDAVTDVRTISSLLISRSESTLPRLSEISEKNLSNRHFWHPIYDTYKAMLKVWRKSWEPFRIYQLTSTANSARFTQSWLC